MGLSRISAKVAALRHFVSKKDAMQNEVLQGVFVTPEESYASNGCRGVRVVSPSQVGDLPGGNFIRIKRKLKSKEKFVHVCDGSDFGSVIKPNQYSDSLDIKTVLDKVLSEVDSKECYRLDLTIDDLEAIVKTAKELKTKEVRLSFPCEDLEKERSSFFKFQVENIEGVTSATRVTKS